MMEFLDEYNNSPGIVSMDLVLFKDAIEHRKSVFILLFKYGILLINGLSLSLSAHLTLPKHWFICLFKP